MGGGSASQGGGTLMLRRPPRNKDTDHAGAYDPVPLATPRPPSHSPHDYPTYPEHVHVPPRQKPTPRRHSDDVTSVSKSDDNDECIAPLRRAQSVDNSAFFTQEAQMDALTPSPSGGQLPPIPSESQRLASMRYAADTQRDGDESENE